MKKEKKLMSYDPKWPEKCCVNCHFLVEMRYRKHRQVDAKRRREIARGEFRTTPSGSKIRVLCHKCFWNLRGGGPESGAEAELRAKATRCRGESCHFLPDQPGMTLEAGEKLEKRLAANRKTEKDRAVVREEHEKDRKIVRFRAIFGGVAAIAAVLGLVVSVLVMWRGCAQATDAPAGQAPPASTTHEATFPKPDTSFNP